MLLISLYLFIFITLDSKFEASEIVTPMAKINCEVYNMDPKSYTGLSIYTRLADIILVGIFSPIKHQRHWRHKYSNSLGLIKPSCFLKVFPNYSSISSLKKINLLGSNLHHKHIIPCKEQEHSRIKTLPEEGQQYLFFLKRDSVYIHDIPTTPMEGFYPLLNGIIHLPDTMSKEFLLLNLKNYCELRDEQYRITSNKGYDCLRIADDLDYTDSSQLNFENHGTYDCKHLANLSNTKLNEFNQALGIITDRESNTKGKDRLQNDQASPAKYLMTEDNDSGKADQNPEKSKHEQIISTTLSLAGSSDLNQDGFSRITTQTVEKKSTKANFRDNNIQNDAPLESNEPTNEAKGNSNHITSTLLPKETKVSSILKSQSATSDRYSTQSTERITNLHTNNTHGKTSRTSTTVNPNVTSLIKSTGLHNVSTRLQTYVPVLYVALVLYTILKWTII